MLDSDQAQFCWVKPVVQKRQARAISGIVLNGIIPLLGRAVRKDGRPGDVERHKQAGEGH